VEPGPVSELRDRIAALLYKRFTHALGYADEPWDNVDHEPWLEDADAVIAELGIFRQYLVDGIISDGEPREWEVPCETRWTTEWERFDGTA
jgi:hypothetical protein